MTQPTSDPMSYLEPIKQSSLEIKNAISQLSQVFPNEVINMRLVNWLWQHISQKKLPQPLSPMNYNTPQGLIDLAEVMAHSDLHCDYNGIRTKKNSMLIQDEHMKWILRDKNQRRIINWLNLTKLQAGLWNPAEPLSDNNHNTAEFITSTDCKDIDVTNKYRSIKYLEQQWNILTATDKIFSWFEKSETQSKLTVAYAWLCDNLKQFRPAQSQMLSEPPQQNFQETSDLMIYFDKTTPSTPEKILYIEKIKRRFNQEKYKESIKDKKQCNYVLKNKTIERLEELSKMRGERKTETIENLINEAYKKTISIVQD